MKWYLVWVLLNYPQSICIDKGSYNYSCESWQGLKIEMPSLEACQAILKINPSITLECWAKSQ
jgi:hypothetical protein